MQIMLGRVSERGAAFFMRHAYAMRGPDADVSVLSRILNLNVTASALYVLRIDDMSFDKTTGRE